MALLQDCVHRNGKGSYEQIVLFPKLCSAPSTMLMEAREIFESDLLSFELYNVTAWLHIEISEY